MKFLSILLALLIVSCSANQTEQVSKYDKALQLIEVSGAKTNMEMVKDKMLSAFAEQSQSISKEFMEEFKKEFKTEELIKKSALIYANHFTVDDMDKMIEFYNTPVGKKFVEKLPQITAEAMKMGQEYGMEAVQKALESISGEDDPPIELDEL